LPCTSYSKPSIYAARDSQLKPREHAQRGGVRAETTPVDHRAREPVDQLLEGQRLGGAAQERRHVLGVVEDPGDEDHGQEDEVHVRGRRVHVGDDVRVGDAERREAQHAERDEDDQLGHVLEVVDAKGELAGDEHDSHLQQCVRHRVRPDRSEPGTRGQRRASEPLQDALLAQVRQVVGQRDEGRRQDPHPGDAGQDHVEHLAIARGHGAEDRQQDQRQQEVEEGRAGVAPEQPALEPVLPPGEGERLSHRR
jgi:hypothetical protein